MNEIKCPHCGQVFTVDESGYAALLNQVRDHEFQRELNERVSLAEKNREQDMALAVAKAEEELRAQIAQRDSQLAAQTEQFRAEAKDLQLAAQNEKAELEKQLEALKAQLQSQASEADTARKLAVADALNAESDKLRAVEKERDSLAQQLETQRQQSSTETQLALQKQESTLKDARIAVERERDELRAQVVREQEALARIEAEHKATLAEKLAAKDELIADREREIPPHSRHESAALYKDARREPRATLRDRVQPSAPHRLPTCLFREGQRSDRRHQGRFRLPRFR